VLAPGAARRLAPVGALVVVALAVVALVGPRRGLIAIVAAVVLIGLFVFLLVFFRDPDRVPGEGVVSAADGRVRSVARADDRWTVSVFMSPLDVHVNRLPLDATVEDVGAAGEGHRPAYRPDAASNVRRSYRLRTEIGPVEVVQITGIAARRLVSFVRAGSVGHKGDRFGMIVLGSRVDVSFPADRAAPVVREGDRVRAGSTTIARIGP
jgi:phosphatidylserine decarboxylase